MTVTTCGTAVRVAPLFAESCTLFIWHFSWRVCVLSHVSFVLHCKHPHACVS